MGYQNVIYQRALAPSTLGCCEPMRSAATGITVTRNLVLPRLWMIRSPAEQERAPTSRGLVETNRVRDCRQEASSGNCGRAKGIGKQTGVGNHNENKPQNGNSGHTKVDSRNPLARESRSRERFLRPIRTCRYHVLSRLISREWSSHERLLAGAPLTRPGGRPGFRGRRPGGGHFLDPRLQSGTGNRRHAS